MTRLSSENDDSSLCYDVIITHQNFKIDQFCDFSCDIDYNSRTDVFGDVIPFITNQWRPQAPKVRLRRAQSVRQPRIASKRSALVYIYIH